MKYTVKVIKTTKQTIDLELYAPNQMVAYIKAESLIDSGQISTVNGTIDEYYRTDIVEDSWVNPREEL